MEKNLQQYHSLQEVAENFSLSEILALAKENVLADWLGENFYFGEVKKLAAALENNSSDAELKLLLCKMFGLNFEKLPENELEEISAVVAKNQREKLFQKYADKNSVFVENQAELVQALKGGAETVYLYGAEFKIPVETQGKTYIGVNNAVIDFTHDSDIDLDARNIILEDLQIYLRYPITLKMDQSKNIKILNGTKKILGIRPKLTEIFEILRGRGAFENPANFRRRAEDIRGVAIGEVLLKDENYRYDENIFAFQPQWNFEYVSVLKNFAQSRKFFLKLAPVHAETLYTNERKLQIFADFTYIDGKLTILNLYLETDKLGRIMIESFLREVEKALSENLSSGGGLAYGLHIITSYKKIFEEIK